MYDTATRVALVKKRVRQKRCRQEKRVLCGLSAFCVVLSLSLMGAMGTIAGYGHSAAVSMYGSILLHEDVGGYVLVGVTSFTAAVIITVLCIKYRKQNKTNDSKEEKHTCEND